MLVASSVLLVMAIRGPVAANPRATLAIGIGSGRASPSREIREPRAATGIHAAAGLRLSSSAELRVAASNLPGMAAATAGRVRDYASFTVGVRVTPLQRYVVACSVLCFDPARLGLSVGVGLAVTQTRSSTAWLGTAETDGRALALQGAIDWLPFAAAGYSLGLMAWVNENAWRQHTMPAQSLAVGIEMRVQL